MYNESQLLKIIEKGEKFAELLASDAFNLLGNELVGEIYNEFNAMSPGLENQGKVYDLKLELEAVKRIMSRCKSHKIAGDNASRELMHRRKQHAV